MARSHDLRRIRPANCGSGAYAQKVAHDPNLPASRGRRPTLGGFGNRGELSPLEQGCPLGRLQNSREVGCFDLGDRTLAQVGVDEPDELLAIALPGAFRERGLLGLRPLLSKSSEWFLPSGALRPGTQRQQARNNPLPRCSERTKG